MTPGQGDDDEVQRMLALKRHEQPPPTFFHGFSEKVIAGIHSAGPAPKLTLRQRLSVEFYGVPIYICAAGVMVCGLLVAGLIGSVRVEPPKAVDGESGGAHTLVPPPPKPQFKAGSSSTDAETSTESPGGLQPARANFDPDPATK